MSILILLQIIFPYQNHLHSTIYSLLRKIKLQEVQSLTFNNLKFNNMRLCNKMRQVSISFCDSL